MFLFSIGSLAFRPLRHNYCIVKIRNKMKICKMTFAARCFCVIALVDALAKHPLLNALKSLSSLCLDLSMSIDIYIYLYLSIYIYLL